MSVPATDPGATESDPPACYECGNDIGPYDGLCLDCLEQLHPDLEGPHGRRRHS